MKDVGLGRQEAGLVMDGRFAPRKPTRTMAEKVVREARVQNQNRVVRDLPMGEIASVYGDLVGTPLVAEQSEPTFDTLRAEAVAAYRAGDEQQARQLAAQAAQLRPSAPAVQQNVPTTVPSVSPPAETRQGPPAELLGENLFDRMRNMEILQRQQDE